MSWIGRAFSSVSSYYKEINPATLSGAIDIIVVCRSSTDIDPGTGEQRREEEFACSPWHVRFGKLSVLRPVERKVIIEVNGEQVPFSMKISETGEAFFVFETTSPVPSELQTSPLVEPISDAELAENARREKEAGEVGTLDALEAVPDFDLGESRATGEKNEFATPSATKKQAKTESLAPESPKSSAPSEASTGITVPSSRETTPALDSSIPLNMDQDPGSATPASSEGTPRQSGSSTPKEKEIDTEEEPKSSKGEDKAPGFLKAPIATAASLGRAAISGATRESRLDKVVRKQDGKTKLEEEVSKLKKEDDKEPVHSRAEGEGHHAADRDSEVGALEAKMREDLTGRRERSASGRDRHDGGGAGGQEGEDVRKAARAQRQKMDVGVKRGDDEGRVKGSEGSGAGDGSKGMTVATGPHPVEKAEDMFTSGPGPQIGPDPITIKEPEGEQGGGRRPRSSSRPTRPGISRSTSAVSTKSQRHRNDELMLDMDGYKLTSSDDAKAAEMGRALLAASTEGHDPDDESFTATAQGVLGSAVYGKQEEDPSKLPDGGVSSIDLNNDMGKAIARGITGHHGLPDEEEVMAFTKALLRSADRMRPKDIAGEGDSGDEDGDGEKRFRFPLRPNSPGAGSDAGSPPPFTATSPQLRPVLDDAVPEGPGLSDNADVSLINAASVPYQFSLRADGTVHIFELSLCGDDHFGTVSETLDAQAFQDRKVSFGQFIDQPDVVNHQALVMKYHDRYLTWENASPVLASLAIYRKSLPEDYAKKMVAEAGVAGPTAHAPPGTEKRSRPWARWWTKSRSDTVLPLASTSPTTSPRPSPPPSPRSLPVMEEEDKGLPPAPDEKEALGNGDISLDTEPTKHYAKTLRLTSDQLRQLGLKKGLNHVSFSVRSSYSGYAICTSRIFLWDGDYQVCISDIDGTITKSDALGHVFAMVGRDWTHAGVAKLYTDIARNGYQIMYLTSRAIGQADTTREYLKGINQHGFVLPDGPVIMSPDRLMTSLHREVIMRKPEVFKMACLRDIQRLFSERNPFYAGFGNRITDALSYRSVDVPSSRIFTIDTNGDVKMELLELAGYRSSYIHMTDLVDQMFPPINRKAAPDYTDFNFWRAPLPTVDLPDLAPPSPALSARSGDSRLSFPRLGSLALGRSKSPRPDLERQDSNGSGRSPRKSRAHPTSPLVQPMLTDEPDDFELNSVDEEEEGSILGRERSDSMPGSLPGSLEEASLNDFRKRRPMTEAEEYRQAIELGQREEGREDSGDFGDREDDEPDDDDFPQMDFSSVPYL